MIFRSIRSAFYCLWIKLFPRHDATNHKSEQMDLYKAAESGPPSEFEAFSETALTSTLKGVSMELLRGLLLLKDVGK
jgi:hypothetical protein